MGRLGAVLGRFGKGWVGVALLCSDPAWLAAGVVSGR